VILQGSTVIGSGTEVGPDTRLVDTVVGDDCVVQSTTGRHARIGDRSTVGPYASLGAGSDIAPDSVTGPFYTAESGL
jgi:bifunctional UDP-N-acetylglucosamine pyrophosphorylase/glucosamine-1-phosphate N-acetyltransferase